MQKATHINVGLTTTLLLIIKTTIYSIFYIFYIIFALIQDWDHSQGSLAQKFGISLPFKHRGFTHTLLFILLAQLGINLGFIYLGNLTLTFKDQIILFFLLHSHLFADIWTVWGIPYLWPIYKKPITIPGISQFTTGTNGEYFFNLVITGINIFLIYYIISSEILQKIAKTIESTQTLVLSSPKFFFGTLILFFIFGIHLISTEIKEVSKNTIKLGKTIFKMILTLIITFISIIIVSFLIQHFIFPEINIMYFIIWTILLTIFSVFVLFNKHLEFISKSSSYIVNIVILAIFFILTFNVLNLSQYLIK